MKYPYLGRRIGATVVDYTMIFFFTFAYIFLIGERQADGRYMVTGWLALAPYVFWFLYFVVAESYLQGTFGHQLFKVKVVDVDGSGLFFGQVLVRRLCDILEIVWCFGLIAFLLARSTDKHQRLGDLLAKTRVVGVNDSYPYDEFQFDFDQK